MDYGIGMHETNHFLFNLHFIMVLLHSTSNPNSEEDLKGLEKGRIGEIKFNIHTDTHERGNTTEPSCVIILSL